jgi:hypothetical protein
LIRHNVTTMEVIIIKKKTGITPWIIPDYNEIKLELKNKKSIQNIQSHDDWTRHCKMTHES